MTTYNQEGHRGEEEVCLPTNKLLLFSIIQGTEKIKGLKPGLDQRQAQYVFYLYSTWECIYVCVCIYYGCLYI